MGLSRDIIRGSFIVVGIAFAGALLDGNEAFASWISATFFSGQPLGFYQHAAIFSVVAIIAYILASVIAINIVREEEEE